MNESSTKKLSIIIVAAGCSSRLGQAKQLVEYENISLLRRISSLASELSNHVTCIFGFHSELMQQQVSGLKLECRVNEAWEQGMGTSIALGVKHLNKDADAVLILLCDQWRLTKQDLQGLIRCWQQQPSEITASYFEYDNSDSNSKVVGCPAIFPRAYFKPLMKLTSSGAKALLQNNQRVILHHLTNAQYDIDTPEDLSQLS